MPAFASSIPSSMRQALDPLTSASDELVSDDGADQRVEDAGGCNVQVINGCIEYIERNLNEKITLDDLAALCGRDKFQVIRTFRRSLGTTPHAFIVEARVSRAAELLRSGEPAAEVAYEVGFVDQSHLIRYFKRHLGVTPKRFVHQY